jgi:hypothetical protein
MGIAQIQVNEYTCELCGYKWINRVNGKDGPIPKRCAKCKHQHWEKGHINSHEKAWRDAVKKRFGYFNYPGGMFHGGWRVEKNVKRYLEHRPSIEEMSVLLKPMCYHYTRSPSSSSSSCFKPRTGCVPTFPDVKYVDVQATEKAHEYEKQLSRQLLKQFMVEKGISYDENEAKKVTLYWRHRKYATFTMRCVPELCQSLKEDRPELSNEEIKARVLKDFSEQLKYLVASPEELIQACWPDWIK